MSHQRQPASGPRPKIYFACAISAGRQLQPAYAELVYVAARYGTVLTAGFAAANLNESGVRAREINERDLNWLVEADLLIAEITVPSLGVGYEIAKAESWAKPVLALHCGPSRLASPMITGAQGVAVCQYRDPRGADRAIRSFIQRCVRRRARGNGSPWNGAGRRP